eukprot:TRINITY_DN4914_c3_g1_i1.p1 TRINITY_DN4914_c3_g1~~TRINITY_DN4914_c3_g1_i1.p1  ORF type:complete len:126 (+),score=50.97 TRINITY_DN4914_c3_g1_i1:2-379(+)
MLEKIFKVRADNQSNYDKDEIIQAIRERVSYLHYLRVATQFMEYQNAAVEAKTDISNEKVKKIYKEYLVQKEAYFKGEKILRKLEEETKKRAKDINVKTIEIRDREKAEEDNPKRSETDSILKAY